MRRAGQPQETTPVKILGEHARRIRLLEFRKPPNDGIRFDVDNEGGWLWVVTNDSTDIDYGELGLALVDRSGFGLYLRAESDDGFSFLQLEDTSVTLSVPGSGTLDFNGGGSAPVNWDVGAFTVDTNGGMFQIDTGGGGVNLVNGPFQADGNGQDITLSPQGGNLLLVGLPTTNPGGTNRVWRDSGTLKIT